MIWYKLNTLYVMVFSVLESRFLTPVATFLMFFIGALITSYLICLSNCSHVNNYTGLGKL